MSRMSIFFQFLLTGIYILVITSSLLGKCSQDLHDALGDIVIWSLQWKDGLKFAEFTALNGQSVYVLDSDSQVSFISARLRLNVTIHKDKGRLTGAALLGVHYASDTDDSIIARVISGDSAGVGCLQAQESQLDNETPNRDTGIILPQVRVCRQSASTQQQRYRHVSVRSCAFKIPTHEPTMPTVRADSKALVKMLEADMSNDRIANSVPCDKSRLIIPHMSVFAPWMYVLAENGCDKTMNTIYMIYRDGSSYFIERYIPYDNFEFARLATLIRESAHETITLATSPGPGA